jgi:hypothetical protein
MRADRDDVPVRRTGRRVRAVPGPIISLAALVLVTAGPFVAVLLLITRRPHLNLITVIVVAGLLWLILLGLAAWLLRGRSELGNGSK